MEWEKLLYAERLEPLDIPSDMSKYPMNDFDLDYWRIVNSAPFRRLQDKTQVFPLDKSDFVRTRLTHSLETSALAKQLTTMVMANMRKEKDAVHPITEEQARDAAIAVMCAGLLHDIGNPPFGHFGEVVIGDWFKENLDQIKYKDKTLLAWLGSGEGQAGKPKESQMVKDLCNFEGNAQALRLLSKVYHVDSNYGMNLMPAVLNTLVKYPVSSIQADRDHKDVKRHKLGYYKAEAEFFDQLAVSTGTKMEDGTYQRHPLTYILEAADDIAYATADLEDAYKKGLFTLDEFDAFFRDTLKRNRKKWEITAQQVQKAEMAIDELSKLRKEETSSMIAFQRWIAFVRHWLMYTAAYGFYPYGQSAPDYYARIMSGTFQSEIMEGGFHKGTIHVLKAVMKRYVYDSDGILTLELAAQTILTRLLSKFVPAVLYLDATDEDPSEYQPSATDKKLIKFLSKNQIDCYHRDAEGKDEGYRLYLRLLLVTDYISGMTDSFAKSLYQELMGIY